MLIRPILLCTLGASWAVIPEIYGWLAPDTLDLYANHPEQAALNTLKGQHQLHAPQELWVCTTGGGQTAKSLAYLRTWWQALGQPFPLRVWVAEGTDQLASQNECEALRELILRAALAASEQSGGYFLASLAGGRKTMSADLQDAAQLFGARAFLHVVGPEPLPEALRSATPTLFTQPLPADVAGAIRPLVAGQGSRSELLDIRLDGESTTENRFPLPKAAANGEPCYWHAENNLLHCELVRRRQEGSRLFGNFVAELAQQQQYPQWQSLYRLPAQQIAYLRENRLTEIHKSFLTTLPKADLHRHLGGCLSVAEQRKVAEAVWNALSEVERQRALSQISTLLDDKPWDWHWPMLLKGRMPTDRAAASAALLLHADPELLEQALYGQTEPRVGLKSQHRQGFAAYERPGELTGSAQLCHPAALLPYAQALVEQAEREGLAYVELRGSPHKYRSDSPAQFVADLEAALRLAGGETHAETIEATHLLNPAKPRFGFIWILDRRQRDTMAVTIQQAVAAHQQLPEFLLGLDLAGDEGTHNPQQLAAAFIPAFEACMPITIHAGEGESADNIWQAAYHLHADRIGHGLTLTTHPQLAQRFRDRGIALELCPTSNREVVGFNDPAHAESSGFPMYPLRHMLDMGLPLSLCTDNPGISRTDIANEYLCAARMIDGLNLWETLALIRQGFMHSFLPAKARDQQLARLESIVFKRVSDFFDVS